MHDCCHVEIPMTFLVWEKSGCVIHDYKVELKGIRDWSKYDSGKLFNI